MMQYNYTLIINLITSLNLDRIISVLEQEKINIATANDFLISDPEYLGAGLFLYLRHDLSVDAVGEIIQEILTRYNIKYFSISIMDATNNLISWTQSNIRVPAKNSSNSKKQIKKVPYLRLVPKPLPTPEEPA
jgi:hypothetical protein